MVILDKLKKDYVLRKLIVKRWRVAVDVSL